MRGERERERERERLQTHTPKTHCNTAADIKTTWLSDSNAGKSRMILAKILAASSKSPKRTRTMAVSHQIEASARFSHDFAASV